MTPGANALATAEAVKTRMAQLAETFPSDINWTVPYDTTLFISESINEVVRTLIEAMVLVFVVMFLFRSEEHTSELPSLMRISYAVFCLKKKTNHRQHHNKCD